MVCPRRASASPVRRMQRRLPGATLSRNQKTSKVQVEAGVGRGEAVSVEGEAQENPMDGETQCFPHHPVLEEGRSP